MGRDTELFKAAQTGNILALEKAFSSQLKKVTGTGLSRNKLHPNIQDAAGSTLLHHAILNGHNTTVDLLLKCGASTKIADNSGSPPLHLAAWKGDLDIVKKLITQGPSYANVNQQNDSDETALHLASQYGYAPVVEFLLQRHADPLLRNSKNETPLDLAAQYGHLSCVHYLISFSPETLRPTLKGFSPLHLAARNGHSIVSLSLINAGISINTVCERGTALHEAAMCGKTETVELLLDKGVNTELKDVEGRTVMDLLDQFTANQATEIQRKISNHIREQKREYKHRSSKALPVPTTSRVIAVAKTTSQPLIEGSSALAFHTGDHIQVEHASGGGVYVGSVRGNIGSFLAEDVLFYTEQGGHLVATDESALHMIHRSPSPLPDDTTPPNDKPLPLNQKEVPNEGGSEASGDLSTTPLSLHPPHGAFTSSTTSCSPDDIDSHPRSDIFDMSISTCGSRKSAISSSSSSQEVMTSEPSEGHPIGKRNGSKKLSKREKRFQLSKDDGKYAELNPINPHQAKREFGDALVLNPVLPAGVAEEGVASLEEEEEGGGISAGQGNGDLMGAYYVLEVGNFDLPPSPTSPEPGMEQRQEVLESNSPLPGSGYFTVSTSGRSNDVMDNEEDGRGFYASLPSNHGNKYENVSLRQRTMTEGHKEEGHGFKLHPHLIMVDSSPTVSPSGDNLAISPPGVDNLAISPPGVDNLAISPPGVDNLAISPPGVDNLAISPPGVDNLAISPPKSPGGRASIYENICPPGIRGVASDNVGGGVESGERNGMGLYENISLLAAHPLPNTSSTINPTPSSNTAIERSEVKRSTRHRKDVYEVIPMRSSNSEGGVADHHSNQPSSPNPGYDSSIVDVSGENPFAGLVMTTSHQLEETLRLPSDSSPSPLTPPPSSSSETKQEKEALWDSMKVEQEWTQIDTLLEGVSGTIGDHTSSSLLPMTTTNKGCGMDVTSWLTSGGMSGCINPLEVNGFDNLRFLGSNILSMDDLPDIGITLVEDQYNLMAAVSLLAPPPTVSHASTVVEWLWLLDLSHLKGKFVDYSLKKISNLWDIELTSVLGVELLGYRKRLLYGISELRHTHPEWAEHNTYPGTPPKKRKSPKKTPPTSTPLTKVSFLKDYRTSNPTSIKMRTPAEAQSYGGEGKVSHHTTLPSQTWRHPNDALIKDSINYEVKYLGSVLIKNLHGNQSAEEACLKLRTSTQDMQKIPNIILSIMWKGVKFKDAQTKKVVSVHSIRDVSSCCLDIEEKKVFAYITKDRSMGKHYSHVFMAPSQKVADEIRMTLGQAFEICYQKVMSVRVAAMATSSN